MASDIAKLMRVLGHGSFAVVGHDRGAYVALRTALDYPLRTNHLVILDAVPIGEALARATATFAERWWHWFFFAQPDKPERAILVDPDAGIRPSRTRWAARTPRTSAERFTIRPRSMRQAGGRRLDSREP